jgi:outer membrane protein TolC
MTQLIKPLLIAIFLFGMGLLHAQGQKKLVLSLDSAIIYAKDHNKSLINSQFEIEKSGQIIKEAISKGLPQIEASVDYSNFLGAKSELQLSELAPPVTIDFNPTSNFNANASQLLFSGNYIVGVQLSRLAKSIAEQSYQKNELEVVDQTTQSYYLVLASEQILNTLKENQTNARSIFEQTTNLANAGVIEQTEAKKLSVMVTTISNAVNAAERQLETGYNLLRFNLGLTEYQEIELSTTLKEIAQQIQVATVDYFRIENNMDYRLLSMQGEISKKSINMAKANYMPTLVAFYSYTEKIKKPVFDMTPKHVLGFTLNIPIFSSGTRSSQLSQAKIDMDINENTKDLLTDQLMLQEKQLRFNFKNLLEQYFNQKNNVSVAREVLDQMNLKFQQGIASSLDLTSANNDYLSAELDFTETILQLLNAELAIRKLNNNL